MKENNQINEINKDASLDILYRVLVTEKFTDPDPLVKQGDKVIVSRGNIATITGKPKAFKTFLTSSIAAAVLEDEFLSISGDCKKLLFVDTEQSKSHVNNVQKRIYRLCHWNLEVSKDELVMLALRELDSKERTKEILNAIEKLKPDLVIIDGIRDLVKDFNSIDETAEIISSLMSVTTKNNCGIITVLHQNKADKNPRGHLGTELCHKSETILQVVNENGIATVSPVFSRNQEISQFSFRVDDSGLPVGCDIPKVEKNALELKKIMQKAMSNNSYFSKAELEARVKTEIGKSEKTAKRRVKDALDKEIIKYNNVGYIILATNENIDNGEIPF